MRSLSIIIAIFVLAILIISAISVVYLIGDSEDFICEITIYKPEYRSPNQPDEPDDGPGIPGGEELKHTVFIEEGTATWCINCPNVAQVIHDLYESGDYNFYYVSLIDDKNEVAQKRLKDDYSIYGYPTVFIDGGYKIVSGEKAKSEFANAIRSAESRDVPKLKISVEISYNNVTGELETKVLIENNEDYIYDGTLKVYLTEKISRWVNRHKTGDGEIVQYHFGFLDFIIDKNVNYTCLKACAF